jgi:hypothetical protein
MGEAPRSQKDRRSHGRSDLLATAIVVHRNRPVGWFVVQNLSAGGALLTGSHAVEAGQRVRVLLRLSAQRMVAVWGKVVRRSPSAGGVVSLAVAFPHPSDVTQDVLQEEALASLLRAGRPAVLVLSDRRDVRMGLAGQVERMGRAVRTAGTPLDAVRWLEDPAAHIDTVVVPRSMGRPGAFAMLGFFADEYPALRRVLLPDGPASLASTAPADTAASDRELAHLLQA